jgi:hypothetical protein
MRSVDDWDEMKPFDVSDEGATVSFVKATHHTKDL